MRKIRIEGGLHARDVIVTDVDTGKRMDDLYKIELVMENGLDNLAILTTYALVEELDVQALVDEV